MNKYKQLFINYYNRMGGGKGLAFRALAIATALIIILLLITNYSQKSPEFKKIIEDYKNVAK